MNHTIQVQKGHITFRYWIKKVRTESNNTDQLPCKIIIRLDGIEYFIYNKSQVYAELEKIINNGSIPQSNSLTF